MTTERIHVASPPARYTPEERFERFDTVDVQLPGMPPRCHCWQVSGPYAQHPGGCLCRCHGGRSHDEIL